MLDIINNIDKIHTTPLGKERIIKNLNLNTNEIEYCKNIILDKNSHIYKKGKNYYILNNNIKITINSYNYTIITAHIIKGEKNEKK